MSQPLKPFLDPIVVAGSLHCYIWQSQRGELVMGGAVDPYPLYSSRSALEFKEGLMLHMLDLFPFLSKVKIMRQWAGISDMTPDFSPVMGATPLENYFIDSGWGTWGFKATPVCGKRMAECLATGRTPDILAAFALDRFRRFEQVGEAGAAPVGHWRRDGPEDHVLPLERPPPQRRVRLRRRGGSPRWSGQRCREGRRRSWCSGGVRGEQAAAGVERTADARPGRPRGAAHSHANRAPLSSSARHTVMYEVLCQGKEMGVLLGCTQ